MAPSGSVSLSRMTVLYRSRRLAAPPLKPSGSSRPVHRTGRDESSGFVKAGNARRNAVASTPGE
jgi:hypothetical protein